MTEGTVLLGKSIRLFDPTGPQHIELESTRVIESPRVTHLRFRLATYARVGLRPVGVVARSVDSRPAEAALG